MSTAIETHNDSASEILLKNNQQIAHDLRSPLSALNFLSSMNPEMPEASKELLAMAISRLEDMANKLEKGV
jgi:hypothetical protein